jgi:hypothetical protein
MARLTSSDGTLLGGLGSPPPGRPVPPSQTKAASVLAPPATATSPEYGPDEIVFALRCSLGSLAYLSYSSGTDSNLEDDNRWTTRHRDCPELVEDPDERHYCPDCGGYYCSTHAEPAAHDCRSALRTR